ncbi:MAG: DUF5615 family PIN-like protein [Chloroflexota bacterium]
MASLRFYLDENVPVQVAQQLTLKGIDAITVRDLDMLGDSDANHLQKATELNRVLCTYDSDFIHLAMKSEAHAGIVFGQQSVHYIGEWVNWLSLMHSVYTAEDMKNRIEYI